MSSRRLCLASMLLAAGLRCALAQPAKVVELEHADSLVGLVVDGQDARKLSGHVRIRQENVIIQCDQALQFIVSGMVHLTGHVVAYDDSMTMTAPRGMYDRGTRHIEAYDHVTLDDGVSHLEAEFGEYDIDARVALFRSHVTARDTGSVLFADTLRYERNRKLMHATGTVRVLHPRDAITITGGDLINDGLARYSRVTVSPVLVKYDTAAGGAVDTLIVEARVMESFQDSVRRLRATDSVSFVRSDLAGRAGAILFYTAGDSLELRHAPILWYQETQVTGDSINVYLIKRALDRIVVMGSAFAISRGDSLRPERFDQLAGETLIMQFNERALRRIDVDVRALSVYHLYDDSLANGLNKTSGDRIIMLFADGRAKTIRVVGGVEGQYFPEPMVRRREREYRLPGFLWRDERPRLRVPTEKVTAP